MIQVPAARTYGRSGRPWPAALPAVADAEAERALGGAGPIGAAGRADVAGPAHAGAVLQLAVGFGHGEQAVGRVAAPVDPVRAAGQGQVAVPVDHPGHDRGAARVHDLGVRANRTLIVRGPDPGDPALRDQHAHAEPEPVRAGVGERRVAVEDGT